MPPLFLSGFQTLWLIGQYIGQKNHILSQEAMKNKIETGVNRSEQISYPHSLLCLPFLQVCGANTTMIGLFSEGRLADTPHAPTILVRIPGIVAH